MKKPNSPHNPFDQINRATDELDLNSWEECFYRGESQCDYDLMPSLLRRKFDDDTDIIWMESAFFYEFSTRAKSLYQTSVNDRAIFFYMRHHGVPTRLMDWTETLELIKYFLAHAGVNDNILFPDLDDLSQYLKSKDEFD